MVTIILIIAIILLVLYIAREDQCKDMARNWLDQIEASTERRRRENKQRELQLRNEANFRKHFGTSPPRSPVQRQILYPQVTRWLKGLAETLGELYEVEEGMVIPAKAKTAQGAKFWMAASEKLRTLIEQCKQDFYDARDAAKDAGFTIPENYGDYANLNPEVEPAFLPAQ